MRDPSSDGEFLGSISDRAPSGAAGRRTRTTAPGRRPRSAAGSLPRPEQTIRLGRARAANLAARALRDALALARSPWFWVGGAVAVAAYLLAVGPLVRWTSGAGEPGESVMVGEFIPIARLWAVPAGVGLWAVMACAGPLPRGRAFWPRYAARALGRILPLAGLAVLVCIIVGVSGDVAPTAIAVAASAAALSTALCGALGASVRAAVVRPALVWPAAAALALWTGAGNIVAVVLLAPGTSSASPRTVAVNVVRDEQGRLVDFECTDYRLGDYETQHPEAIAWLAAANPLVLQIAVSEGTQPADSAAGYAPVILEAAATGPGLWEPCVDGSGPQSTRPPIGLGPLGTLQLALGAGALAVVGARRTVDARGGRNATRRGPGSGSSPSPGGPAASP